MFIEVLFVIAPNYPMPLKVGWTTKLWYISKKKKILFSNKNVQISTIYNKDESCKHNVG